MTEIAHAPRLQETNAEIRPAASAIADILPGTRWLAVLLLPLLALKLLQVFVAAPTADEAYYWLWGQKLALSYYDHPPLAAWLQRLSAETFGWNLFALRAPAIATFAGSLSILWFWSKRLAGPKDGFRAFLGGLVFWLSMPMLMRFQSLAHQDHLLIFFGLATAHFWALFEEGSEGGDRRWRYYYLGCLMLGLAGLSKYNAVFIGLGFAAWVPVSPRGRKLLVSSHLWAGAALAAALQAPVLIWNMQHGWPSFRYNLDGRIGDTLYGGFAGNLQSFAITSLIMASPVFWVAAVRFLAGRESFRTPFQTAGRLVFLVSTAAFIALCATTTTLSYWNIAAYIFILPVAVFYLRSQLEFGIHAAYGILTGVWIVAMTVIYPAYKTGGSDNRDNDISFGLSEIAAIVQAEEKRLGADMVLTTDYRTASLLSFATKRLDIGKIGSRDDQFDLWFDASAHAGKDGLVLADDFIPVSDMVEGVFDQVTPVREIAIRRFGFTIHTYRLYLAEGYSGQGGT